MGTRVRRFEGAVFTEDTGAEEGLPLTFGLYSGAIPKEKEGKRMAKFVVIYSGGMGMAASEEEQQKIMAEWGAWYGKLGDSVVDGGAPFGASKHFTAVGAGGDGPLGDTPATGYTVISADSLDAAAAACQDHPHLNHGGQVQVFEWIDMS